MPKYSLHHGSHFQLGHLFNPLEPFSTKPDLGIIEWSATNDNTAAPSGGNLDFKYYQIEEQHEYYKALSIDMNLEARWALANGEFSLNFSKNIAINNTSFALVLIVEKKYNPETTNGQLTLGGTGKAILNRAIKANAINRLPALTGTEVVTSITKGSRVSLIYHVTASSIESKTALLASLGAKWGSNSASFNFSQEMHQIDSKASLQIEISHLGASLNSDVLSSIIEKPDNLITIRQSIADQLEQSTYTHATVLEAHTTYLHENIIDFIFPEENPQKGEEILSTYKNFADKIKAGNEVNKRLYPHLVLLRKYEVLALNIQRHKYRGMRAGAQAEIASYLEYLRESKDILRDKYKKTLEEIQAASVTTIDGTTKVEQINPINLSLYLEMPQALFISWNNSHHIEAHRRGGSEFYDFHAKVSLIMVVRNIDLVESIEIYRDGRLSGHLTRGELLAIQNNGGDTVQYWKQDFWKYNDYGWGVHGECHRCAAIRERIRTIEHPEYESKYNYTLTARLIDDSKQTINLGNLKNYPKSFAENLKVKFLDNILPATSLAVISGSLDSLLNETDSPRREKRALSESPNLTQSKHARIFAVSDGHEKETSLQQQGIEQQRAEY